MAILGRLLHVQLPPGDLHNMAGEQKSSLSIKRTFVKGAGTDARDIKRHASRRSWSIETEGLFELAELEFVHQLMARGVVANIAFGANENGYRYFGQAFPTRVRIRGSVNGLVKMAVNWQGTGMLDYDVLE